MMFSQRVGPIDLKVPMTGLFCLSEMCFLSMSSNELQKILIVFCHLFFVFYADEVKQKKFFCVSDLV